MIFRFERLLITFVLVLAGVFLMTGCEGNMQQPVSNTATNQMAVNTAQPSPAPPVSNTQPEQTAYAPVTLPVLDAMFTDGNFAAELKSKLGLTDEQIAQLQKTAREATANLKENGTNRSTVEAKQFADEKIRAILGADKASELAKFVGERWANGDSGDSNDKPAVTASNSGQPNGIPTDTRIVVNAPAYRMDLFKDGKLVRSYKIGIGYPEFPLPTGMRQAKEIIFNPTWTPPDEPWVEGSNKVQAGKKVEAGSALNPLGPIKIPIGLPSLIHGGKNPSRLGEFASHGCVGLTSPQVQDFSLALAQLSGTQLTTDDVANYEKQKTETKNLKLSQNIPVELRYETIVVENGVLKIYRDVYERGTNTDENLRKVLEAQGVSLDSLSEPERAKIQAALKQMAVDAGGDAVEVKNDTNKNTSKKEMPTSGKVTRTIVGKKEVDIPIAALKGKGYPAPVDLNTGGKSAKPLNLAINGNPANSNSASGNLMKQTNSNRTTQANSNSTGKKF